MLDVKTPLSKLHRTIRRIVRGDFSAAPGLWAYVDSADGKLKNIASTSTNQAQKAVLKIVLGNASTSQYESHDVEVGSVATIETVFRAAVDTNGYQRLIGGTGTQTTSTAVSYSEGDELTVAYRYTSATANTSYLYAQTADIGKLRPVVTNDEVVVARVEGIDTTNNILTFQTVTPYPKQGL